MHLLYLQANNDVMRQFINQQTGLFDEGYEQKTERF